MSTPSDVVKTLAFNARVMDAPKPAHYLTVLQGVTIRRAVPLGAEPQVLGRDPSRPFHLPDADVSRSHCEVRLVGDRVLVRDLGSTNGTFVDGVRIEAERALPVSSQLQIGGHVLRHELLNPQEASE